MRRALELERTIDAGPNAGQQLSADAAPAERGRDVQEVHEIVRTPEGDEARDRLLRRHGDEDFLPLDGSGEIACEPDSRGSRMDLPLTGLEQLGARGQTGRVAVIPCLC